MPAVEINLTTEQLASAYAQLSKRERRNFILSVLTQPANEEIAIEVLAEIQATVRRKPRPPNKRTAPLFADATKRGSSG